MLRRSLFLLVLLLAGCQQSQPVTPSKPTPETATPTLNDPSNFTAISTAPDMVELSWTAPSGVTGYWLERAKDSGDYQLLTELGLVSSFSDSSVLPKTIYRYRLFAYSSNSIRSSGAEVSVTTLLPVIPDTTYIQGDARSSTVIELQWLEVFGAVAYKIERKTGASSFLEIASFPASTKTFKDTGLKPDTLYTYRVRTETPQGLSVGAEIIRRTYDTKTWRTPVEIQRDPNLRLAQITPLLGKGAMVIEQGVSNGNNSFEMFMSFISPTGVWGTSQRLDFDLHPQQMVSNSKGEVVAAWFDFSVSSRLFVKRYNEQTGWRETETINLPGPTAWSLGALSYTLADDGTVRLMWQQDEKKLWTTSSSEFGVWTPAYELESVTGNERIAWPDWPRLFTGIDGATFAVWTIETGDRESYKLRVSRHVGTTWTTPETLVNEEHFSIKYDLSIQPDGSATLVWANGSTYALHFTPGAGWGEQKLLNVGYYGSLYDRMVDNDKGVVAVLWRKDFTLYAVVYTPGFGWGNSQIIMDNLNLYHSDSLGVRVTPENEIFVFADLGLYCSTLHFVRYKIVSGWSEPAKISGDLCISDTLSTMSWFNGGSKPMAILNNRWMTSFE